jgi:hypothetical protein
MFYVLNKYINPLINNYIYYYNLRLIQLLSKYDNDILLEDIVTSDNKIIMSDGVCIIKRYDKVEVKVYGNYYGLNYNCGYYTFNNFYLLYEYIRPVSLIDTCGMIHNISLIISKGSFFNIYLANLLFLINNLKIIRLSSKIKSIIITLYQPFIFVSTLYLYYGLKYDNINKETYYQLKLIIDYYQNIINKS